MRWSPRAEVEEGFPLRLLRAQAELALLVGRCLPVALCILSSARELPGPLIPSYLPSLVCRAGLDTMEQIETYDFVFILKEIKIQVGR